MKKQITISAFLLMLAASSFAQIPNNGFENWTSLSGYENPDGWSTMNNSTASFSIFTATKASPGNPGNSYLKLTSKTVGSSVVNGVAVSGKMDTISQLPISGFPFTQRPANFAGKWQHMIFGTSQGGLSVLLTKWNTAKAKRDTIASTSRTLSGMAMSWANFSFNLTYVDSFNYPDSCMIVLKSSGLSPTNNDYLWVDALAFTGTVAVLPPPPPPNLVGLKEEKQSFSQVSVFPNPANNFLTLSFELNQPDKLSIQLFDQNGKLIKELVAANNVVGLNKIKMDTQNLAKGIYTIRINGNQSSYHHKLVIE